MSKDVKYFPGLDGLRFIGAFAVIFSQIEFLKSLYGFENLMDFRFYQKTNSLIKLNTSIIKFLRQILYGLNVYHWLIIILVLNFVKKFMNDFSVFNQNMIIYFFTIAITILISHFSYKYFESFFLKFKTKFY